MYESFYEWCNSNCRIKITHGKTGDPPPRALQIGCYENKAFEVPKFIVAERRLQRSFLSVETKSLRSAKKSVKSLGRCYSLPLTDRHRWQNLGKQLQVGLHSIDKCDLINKDKIGCIYFGLIPKLAWPLQIYEISLTKVETMEGLISKFIFFKWLGVPNSLTNVALYSSSTKLKLPTLSLLRNIN